MAGRLETVMVADVRPSGSNPRKDFGDIERLAAAIRATGGEPVNPIVVVRDGGHYVLVDGERRWKAMDRLGTEECRALVFDDMPEAETTIDMVATDDKKTLTDEERARGFQTMLSLGVDDETVADATGLDAKTVRRVRTSTKGRVPEQTSMEAMLEAADDEFSADEQERIRKSGNLARYTANTIRSEHKAAEALDKIREALPDGIEYLEYEDYPAMGEGVLYLATITGRQSAERFAEEHAGEGDLVGYCRTSGASASVTVCSRMEPDEVEGEKEARAETKRRADESAALMDRTLAEMVAWASTDGLGAIHDDVRAGRPEAVFGHDVPESVMESEPSAYEVADWVIGKAGCGGPISHVGTRAYWADSFCEAFDRMVSLGYSPSDEALECRRACDADEGA